MKETFGTDGLNKFLMSFDRMTGSLAVGLYRDCFMIDKPLHD